MKKIIKSSILLFSFFACANQINAQLASDQPVAKMPVAATPIPAAKVVPVVTASSMPVDKAAAEVKAVPVITAPAAPVEKAMPVVKNSAKIQAIDPTTTQGKESVQPVIAAPAQLPTVSSQGLPKAKS